MAHAKMVWIHTHALAPATFWETIALTRSVSQVCVGQAQRPTQAEERALSVLQEDAHQIFCHASYVREDSTLTLSDSKRAVTVTMACGAVKAPAVACVSMLGLGGRFRP